jgi:hypothetical protein
MRKPIQVSLVAGLTIAGVSAATAESDISVWRWHVANVLRAQQSDAPSLREGRASAVDQQGSFVQRNERYFADGSLAPQGDSAHR